MPSQDRGNHPGDENRQSQTGLFRAVVRESPRRAQDINRVASELEQLLELGPGENPAALDRLFLLLAMLRKILPESHFRDERVRDLTTDFNLWFSKGPRLSFDYNDEALRAMLLVDIHRLKGG